MRQAPPPSFTERHVLLAGVLALLVVAAVAAAIGLGLGVLSMSALGLVQDMAAEAGRPSSAVGP